MGGATPPARTPATLLVTRLQPVSILPLLLGSLSHQRLETPPTLPPTQSTRQITLLTHQQQFLPIPLTLLRRTLRLIPLKPLTPIPKLIPKLRPKLLKLRDPPHNHQTRCLFSMSPKAWTK